MEYLSGSVSVSVSASLLLFLPPEWLSGWLFKAPPSFSASSLYFHHHHPLLLLILFHLLLLHRRLLLLLLLLLTYYSIKRNLHRVSFICFEHRYLCPPIFASLSSFTFTVSFSFSSRRLPTSEFIYFTYFLGWFHYSNQPPPVNGGSGG